MTLRLHRRGPDGEGYFLGSNITLGHRRLSIIDLAGGAQPMSINDGKYRIVYNGEVVNYIELRKELEQQYEFTTASDTEVLLRYYQLKGTSAFTRFNGMFALAIWDEEAGRLVLARDRMGIKPLYYSIVDGELIFCSELKALALHPSIECRLNAASVSKYFTYGYVPAPHTIFERIYKLEAGCCLSFGENHYEVTRYWDVPLQDNPVSDRTVEEGAEDLLALIKDAVSITLRSDVPVGLFLSGGIDSATIAALAVQCSSDKLHSFSIGFDEPSYDESSYSRRLAGSLGTTHHEHRMTLAEATDVFPRVVQRLDEPLADASAVPVYILSQLAAEYVKVTLGGDGGDELFAGYPAFQAHKLVSRLSFLPVGGRDHLAKLVRRLPVSARYASAEFLMQQFVKGLGLSAEARFLLWMGVCGTNEKKSLFSPEFRQELLRRDAFEDVSRYVRQSGLKNDFERLQYLCIKMYLAEDILAKVDRMGMGHSLEVRFPYLDNDLVEYACKIQSAYKLNGFTTKYILKRAARNLLPSEIIRRRKAGFMMPVSKWLTEQMRAEVQELCSPDAVDQCGLFNRQYVCSVLKDHFEHRRDHRKLIYALLAFMAWRQNLSRAPGW